MLTFKLHLCNKKSSEEAHGGVDTDFFDNLVSSNLIKLVILIFWSLYQIYFVAKKAYLQTIVIRNVFKEDW